MAKNTKNTKAIITGAVIGSVVAGAAALLLAPKKGSELRKDIASKSGVLKEKTATIASSTKARISAITARVKARRQEAQAEAAEETQVAQDQQEIG
jgi:gas vesicle protein